MTGPSIVDRAIEAVQGELSSWGRPSLSEFATVLLALATLIVVMGGSLYWIRAGNAGLPKVQTLTVIPQQEFVVVGMRQIAVPMIGYFLLSILGFGAGAAVGGIEKWQQRTDGKGDGNESQLPLYVGVGTFSLGLLLFSPFDWGTGVEAAAAIFYLIVLTTPSLGFKALLAVGVLTAFFAGLATEADSGVRFSRADLQLEGGTTAKGWYLSATGGTTYIGRAHQIEGIPDRKIARIEISRSPNNGSTPESLAGRLASLVGEAL